MTSTTPISPSKSKSDEDFEPIFLHRFLQDARLRSGTAFDRPAFPLPKWVKPHLIKSGQDFIQRNFFSIYFAHFISLLFLLCYEPVRTVLLQTGKSIGGFAALKRYFSTLLHIKAWYEGDLLSHQGSASHDIHRIRRVHAKIGMKRKIKIGQQKQGNYTTPAENSGLPLLKALHKDLTQLDENNNNVNVMMTPSSEADEPRISQLDMSVTQFCFMGFISLYPRVFGIVDDSEGLAGFIHLWALIGHLIGIEEDYNLGLKCNAPARPLILKHVLIPNFQSCDQDTIELWKSLASGIAKIIPFISLKAMLLFVIQKLVSCDLNCSELKGVFNIYDRICFAIMEICFKYLIVNQACRAVLNALLRLAVFLTNIRLFGKISFRLHGSSRASTGGEAEAQKKII